MLLQEKKRKVWETNFGISTVLARGLVGRFTFSSYLHARSRRGRLESDRRKEEEGRRRGFGIWQSILVKTRRGGGGLLLSL